MQKYSNYFETLHDEAQPTGNLGRGTHYSVVRSITFKDQFQQPLARAANHDMAVIWDEDHDERVFELIELLYQHGLLSPAIIVGERKGTFSLIIKTETLADLPDDWLKNYSKQVNDLAQSLDDPWPAEVCILDNVDCGIINDDAEKMSQYVKTLDMLWNLGVQEKPPHIRNRFNEDSL